MHIVSVLCNPSRYYYCRLFLNGWKPMYEQNLFCQKSDFPFSIYVDLYWPLLYYKRLIYYSTIISCWFLATLSITLFPMYRKDVISFILYFLWLDRHIIHIVSKANNAFIVNSILSRLLFAWSQFIITNRWISYI